MSFRFAAASGLALAAVLLVSPLARAQDFFSFYEMSPPQVVSMLEDQGFELRGPLIRRGEVYVCDVDSVSGRPMRLIVSARDGHVLERFAASPRWHNDDDLGPSRPSRDLGDNDARRNEDQENHRRKLAFGDMLNPPSRVYGNDSLFAPKPTPPENVPDAPAHKPKHQVAKKHHHGAVAKAPAVKAPRDAAPTTPSVAAVTPAGEAPKAVNPAKPAETPKAAEAHKPVQEARKPDEAPKSVAKPKPAASTEPVQAKAEVAKSPDPVKPKPAHKKINDLPVGTLD